MLTDNPVKLVPVVCCCLLHSQCPAPPPCPHPALSSTAVFLTCVFLPVSFFPLSVPAVLATSHSDEVASEQPSLPVITALTHGSAAAPAPRHPSPPPLLQETDLSRCKFWPCCSSTVSSEREEGGSGGGRTKRNSEDGELEETRERKGMTQEGRRQGSKGGGKKEENKEK